MIRPESVIAGLLIALTICPGAYAEDKAKPTAVARWADQVEDPGNDHFDSDHLATDPPHASRLKELSTAVDDWMKSTGDAQFVAGKPPLPGVPLHPAEPKAAKSSVPVSIQLSTGFAAQRTRTRSTSFR